MEAVWALTLMPRSLSTCNLSNTGLLQYNLLVCQSGWVDTFCLDIHRTWKLSEPWQWCRVLVLLVTCPIPAGCLSYWKWFLKHWKNTIHDKIRFHSESIWDPLLGSKFNQKTPVLLLTKFTSALHLHCIVCAKGAKFVQSAKKNLVLLFGFPPVVAILISNRFQYVISQMKENKFLIKFLIYYFRVGVMPFELWSNEVTVQLILLHTVGSYL